MKFLLRHRVLGWQVIQRSQEPRPVCSVGLPTSATSRLVKPKASYVASLRACPRPHDLKHFGAWANDHIVHLQRFKAVHF